MRFCLIDAAKKDLPVARLCKVLAVSSSGYFAWKNRPASMQQREDLMLLAHVRSAFTLSHSGHAFPVAPNHLSQDLTASGPDRKWGSDISYIWTREG